jgi:hypothetical protein
MELEERLGRIERENLRLKRLLVMVSSLAGLSLLLASVGPIALSCSAKAPAPVSGGVLRVTRLEIVNPQGTVVVAAMVDERGWGKLFTYDNSGQQLVQLTATDDGGTVAVAGARGQLRAALAVAKGDDGSVLTFDAKNARLISLGKGNLGDGTIFSFNRAGGIKAMWPQL